ncbi:MAG: hypothetical protein Q9M92_02425 [Enterobacterales bacterium]|nr:hypothetical protein [Enterobacterales bacterium]
MRDKTIFIFLTFSILNGCTLLGAVTDSILFDSNAKLFQGLGEEIDSSIVKGISKKNDNYSAKRALERNCKQRTISYEECFRKINELKEQNK